MILFKIETIMLRKLSSHFFFDVGGMNVTDPLCMNTSHPHYRISSQQHPRISSVNQYCQRDGQTSFNIGLERLVSYKRQSVELFDNCVSCKQRLF